ncbi:homoserine O-succinyltransferase MetA [Thermochromatium tepidum]|jgi:homoserine O-succinyltransferase (EC 2.3.1.46)|uniref:Homoserine O-succinyltransferase n=1 Tax=Thermochromatium tepidum ATCC 43061 TaxID=316276 RepID=A0A6I6DXX4_THETI|nr:homoserine O-succinyltransferase [Thermochromatium tepidum]QGU32414.1 homoserine O-succinyltransferase [Thermochromatium tepidum ATCC 43061]
MPIVAHNDLPTFARLREEGHQILDPDFALHQDIRELHIGLLNMMPDAALAATERQFFRLIGESNQIAQFYVHPFTLAELERGPEARAHVERYYQSFDQIRAEGLDALIITGANVTAPDLALEPFWEPLIEVVDWAYDNVCSTLCSCLATHAVMQFRYGERRRRQPFKRWGVFPHRVLVRRHPLVADVNTCFDVPHSRFNDISHEQFVRAGLHVLVESEEAGVHLAVSPDGFRQVLFQGHPEYDTISLLKEYKREVGRFIAGERPDYPPFPDNYFGLQARAILDEHRERVIQALDQGRTPPELPERLIAPSLNNTWHDTAEGVIGNWMGLIYKVTHLDRRQTFMAGIDPNDPLGLGLR